MRIFRIGCLAVLLTLSSFAGTLTITYTSVGTGSVGSTAFTNDSFTITELLDTANRQSFTGGYFIDDTSASIAISGIGTFGFTTPTRSYVNDISEGFSRATYAGNDLLDAPDNSAFSTWDMTTSIGPFTGIGEILQWSLSPVLTTGGTLVFNTDEIPTVTFQAVAGTASTPEPGSLALIGLGLLGLGWKARRRRGAR
jgi:hypothetical protein